jgi:hypothetical protein
MGDGMNMSLFAIGTELCSIAHGQSWLFSKASEIAAVPACSKQAEILSPRTESPQFPFFAEAMAFLVMTSPRANGQTHCSHYFHNAR